MLKVKDAQQFKNLLLVKSGSVAYRSSAKWLEISTATLSKLYKEEQVQDSIANKVATKMDAEVAAIFEPA